MDYQAIVFLVQKFMNLKAKLSHCAPRNQYARRVETLCPLEKSPLVASGYETAGVPKPI